MLKMTITFKVISTIEADQMSEWAVS